MELILQLPLNVRLAILVVVGILLGGQINHGIYRFAVDRRRIDPWSRPPEDAPPRQWWDRLPIIGWFGLRREAPNHGRLHWVRPIILELGFGFGLAGLYYFEMQGGLYPRGSQLPDSAILHAQFLAHATLVGLMMVATFIDFDEQTIPDEITLPGFLLALLFAIVLPTSFMPREVIPPNRLPEFHHVVMTSPQWNLKWLDGLGGPQSWPIEQTQASALGAALLAIAIWYLAVLPKVITWRRFKRNPAQAIRVMFAFMKRYGWKLATVVFLLASGVTVVAFLMGGDRWQAVMTAVVGMAFGAGLTWLVRIVAGNALQAEAMGFGDVTLMAMIGGFLGWQASLLAFFLSPFLAILIAITRFVLTRNREIAFGPYLCAAALFLIVGWDALWRNWAEPFFAMGLILPAIVFCGMILMGGMLWLYRLLGDWIHGGEEGVRGEV